MGKSTERARAYWASTAAVATQQREQEMRGSREQTLGIMEQQLGTDEQISGLGGDARMLPFMERWEIDEGTLHSLSTGAKGGYDSYNRLHQNLESSNSMMAEAQALAESGDFEGAAALRSKAEGNLTDVGGPTTQRGNVFASIFKTVENNEAIAAAKLSNPAAVAVGSMVRDAREFQDWDSQVSRDFRSHMSESGERAVAEGARASSRQARDFGLQRGSARNAGAASAIAASVNRGFAAERAQVHAQTNQFFEGYRRQFARDTTSFAQSWMQNTSGIRQDFQGAMEGMTTNISGLFSKQADMSRAFSAQSAADAQASKDKKWQVVKSVAAVALGAVTGGLGAAAMGSGILGGMAGGAAKAGAASY